MLLGPLAQIAAARAARRTEGISFIPLTGSAAGAIALLAVPLGDIQQRLAWLPVALLPDWPLVLAGAAAIRGQLGGPGGDGDPER
jgi:hypothetical protein